MFIETNNILINVDNITKIYYRVYDSEFEIYIQTNDEDRVTLNYKTKEEFERKWEWIRNTVLIDKQPTAYDIDKVVEQLEKVLFVDVDEEYTDHGQIMLFLHDAIEIVKGGAKNGIQKEAYCD